MRPVSLVSLVAVLTVGCAGSHRANSSSSSPPPGDTATASANPCSDRPAVPARLPDGGVNPEACIGTCTLVRSSGSVASVDAGLAPPTGSIDLRAVDAALRREARTLRGCYDSAVLAHPWLGAQGGTVNVSFIVEENGRVRGRPEATGIEQVPDVATCLANRLRYITFPQPEGGPAQIAVPFNFEGAT